jgi:G3E family GTPase
MFTAVETVDRGPVPFSVIGGFLGAGKTTLINQILRDAAGERILILVNDVGDTPIDPDLIAARNADTITLTNGCVCCSLADDFALGLPELLDLKPPIDRVVVEASGVGDPGRIAQYGTLPGFVLDGVVVLADADGISALLDDQRIGHQVAGQLRRAHLVVLTKTDLVDEAALVSLKSKIAEVMGDAGIPIIESSFGNIAAEVLFGIGIHAGSDLAEVPQASSDGRSSHGIEVQTLEVADPIDREHLDQWLGDLPRDVLRVKGLVNLRENDLSAPRSVVVQKVGPRCRITARVGAASTPRLVVIAIAGTEIPAPLWQLQ